MTHVLAILLMNLSSNMGTPKETSFIFSHQSSLYSTCLWPTDHKPCLFIVSRDMEEKQRKRFHGLPSCRCRRKWCAVRWGKYWCSLCFTSSSSLQRPWRIESLVWPVSFTFGRLSHATRDLAGKESFLWLVAESPQSFICANCTEWKWKSGGQYLWLFWWFCVNTQCPFQSF